MFKQQYDYGNGAITINPDNIASINILKGAAATALYGSRTVLGVQSSMVKIGSEVTLRAILSFSK